jgi:hypothetical protein
MLNKINPFTMPFYIQNTSLYFPDKKTTIAIKGMVRKPTCVRSYKLIENHPGRIARALQK